MGSSGSLAFLGVQALNAVTGNIDRAGGALVPSRAVRFSKLARLLGRLRPPRPSRIGNFPPVAESLPTGILADEILTPGAGQIRALLCIAGNPLLSAPSGTRLGEALRSLDLLVSIDLYRNETGALGHWTLPSTDWLEREDFPLVQAGMQPEPYAQLSPAVVPARGGTAHVRYAWPHQRVHAPAAEAPVPVGVARRRAAAVADAGAGRARRAGRVSEERADEGWAHRRRAGEGAGRRAARRRAVRA